MANFTEKAIKEAFIDLLEKKQIKDITVKDIVESCGINRNTFYYHFGDIPCLVNEITRDAVQKIISSYPSVTSIVECFDAASEFALENKKAIVHIYDSENRDMFERELLSLCGYFITEYMKTALAGTEISDEDRKAIIRYYKALLFGLVIEWLSEGMKDEFPRSVRRIFQLKTDFASEMAGVLSKQI